MPRKYVPDGAIREDGICLRCREPFGHRANCTNCGVGRDQVIASRNSMRTKKIGGKRGRNSGTVKSGGRKSVGK